MREYCEFAEDFLSEFPAALIDECGFMPESCSCSDCPFYKLISAPAEEI